MHYHSGQPNCLICSGPVRCVHKDFVMDNLENPNYPALLLWQKPVESKKKKPRECISQKTILFEGTADYRDKVILIQYLFFQKTVVRPKML